MLEKISVLLLVQNSEKSLKRCLDSLKSFDEVVVIDGGSSDSTKEIAKAYPNVAYFEKPWPGFIEQRNFSITKATNKWCFMIDSDEAINEDLSLELHKIVNNNPKFVMYRVMRTEFFLGEALEHGIWKSNYQERLFIKDRVKYVGGVHHGHTIDGEFVDETHPLTSNIDKNLRVLHDESYNLDAWCKKLPRFAILIANEKIQNNRKVSAIEVLFTFFITLIKVWPKCVKQGRVGFIITITEAINRTLVKLYIYQNQFYGKKEAKLAKKAYLG